jgi:hypothetical protein
MKRKEQTKCWIFICQIKQANKKDVGVIVIKNNTMCKSAFK